ncbi:carbohydrate sulfotransferase 9-like isoform X2 [Pecten maximus]|uniref:carbohydrate sulfotransferase 9-like isoform X2 n=1 Tax=Pecten maximus TaxID=6579 RepID=UPI0014583576|nr:carbohydrate sulfotransferase 9-like isoform X2 [Pecten maximus]
MSLSVKKVFVTLLSIVVLFIVGLLTTIHVGQDRRMISWFTRQNRPIRNSDVEVRISHVQRLKLFTNTTNGVTAHYEQAIFPTPPLTIEQILESRRAVVQKICAKEFNSSVKTVGRAPIFFYSKSAKMTCCKAPKTGSSFWGTVVLAIESQKKSDDAFHINRNSVHGRNEIGLGTFVNASRHSLSVMVSRDPFTRLFSAYVDKYFLLGQLGRRIQSALKKGPFRMNGGICGYDVSFSDFLNYVTDMALKGVDLNEHFMPVVKLCDPCKLHYDVISKQESLTKDTKHVLGLLKFSDTKKMDIQNSLKKGLKNTVYSLVSSYLTDYKIYRSDCPDRVSHFEKVWKTLQVQGYVSTKADFPRREFQKMRLFDADAITLLILKEVERFPLSKEEKTLQRQSAVSIAYADVGPEAIAKIRKVYKMDFLLFGYDMTPPDKRPGAVTL